MATTPEERDAMRAAGVSRQLFSLRMKNGWDRTSASTTAPHEASALRMNSAARVTAAAPAISARVAEAEAAEAERRTKTLAMRDALVTLAGRGGWPKRFLLVFAEVGPFDLADVAEACGANLPSVEVAANRCGFIFRRRGLCYVVENDRLAAVSTAASEDATMTRHAQADAPRLNPWRRRNGMLKTTMFAPAMRALFSDGEERTALDVARAIGHANASVSGAALRRCEEVEEVRDGVWRRVPTREELRAKIAWLEAEVAQLRGGR